MSSDPEQVTELQTAPFSEMASPGHRAMILTASMRDVNIGVRPGKPGNRDATAATYTAGFGYRN